jgi:hypothetical protein
MDMEDIEEIKNSSAVQAHINMLQGIINRMAANSANCKTWAIAILAALLALYANDKICNSNFWICYIPTGLFFFLDCYYLGLERKFRKKQNLFVNKINKGEDFRKELFTITLEDTTTIFKKLLTHLMFFLKSLIETIKGVFSFSTLPFYGFIFGLLYYLTLE